MALKLLFFAQCADWVKKRETILQLEAPSVLVKVLEEQPDLAPILKNQKILKVAINHQFADFHKEVRDGDEVAFLPPFCGG